MCFFTSSLNWETIVHLIIRMISGVQWSQVQHLLGIIVMQAPVISLLQIILLNYITVFIHKCRNSDLCNFNLKINWNFGHSFISFGSYPVVFLSPFRQKFCCALKWNIDTSFPYYQIHYSHLSFHSICMFCAVDKTLLK